MNDLENKREYEMSYLLTSDIPENKLESEISELNGMIAKNDGTVTLSDLPKIRFLSYPVKKHRQAYFGAVYFHADADGLDAIKKTIALYKNVLRFLIVGEIIKPEPIMKSATRIEPSAPGPTQSFDQRLESILKS